MIDLWPVVLGAGVAGLVTTMLAVGFLVRRAPSLGLLDRPNERSLHVKTTPRGGGLGFVIAVPVFAAVGLAVMAAMTDDVRVSPFVVYALSGLVLAAVSLRDDFRPLGAGVRFLCHFAAAGACIWGIATFTRIGWPFGGELDLGITGGFLTAIWIVGLTNVYNFLDGIDGLAGLQGVVSGLAWAVVASILDCPEVALLAMLLAAGCAGFLRHNWAPARIFMGDVGSAFLGFSFAVLPLVTLASGGDRVAGAVARLPWVAALLVGPFLLDGIYTFLRRARRGERVWTPHRTHLYQRLVSSGWTHAQTAGLYGLWAMVAAAAGLAVLVDGWRWPAFVGLFATAAGHVGIMVLVRRREGKSELNAKTRRREGGVEI